MFTKYKSFIFTSFFGLFCVVSSFAESVDESPAQSASIFVQDPAVFHQRQADLEKLKASANGENAALDSLLERTNRIMAMNDRCATISLNDVMDDECWAFFRVELPAFEEQFMKVTGEVRLGHMEMARGLEDRKLQIEACVDALYSFASSKDQFLNLDGGVFLEPLSSGFQANYDFILRYEPNHRKAAFEIAEKWGETCREMVMRQDGRGFAPYFLERLSNLNDDLRDNGSLALYKVDSASAGVSTLYMDISKPVRSAYYLNGVKLFHSRIAGGPASESHLRISFDDNGVKVDGEPIVIRNGNPAKFVGSVDFPENSKKLNGRWFWENQGNTAGVDFGPEFDVDSLAAETASAEETRAAEESARVATVENLRGVHPSLWIGATASFAPYANEAAYGYGLEEDDLFVMPDLVATVRGRLNFGENAECWLAVGAGAALGFALGDELEKVYVAPVGQFEIGYRMFGFRETAIIPIAGSDEELWLQFRSGVFAQLGKFGLELGYTIITDVGNGGYITVFFGL